MLKLPRPLRGFAVALCSVLAAKAAVHLPAIFGDHMVLQQEIDLPVWGTADPGEKIQVTVAGRQVDTVANAAGNWRVKLPRLSRQSGPVSMEVRGTNTLVFQDVLIGDVWLCSGQSNMEFGLGRAHNAAEALPQADHPQLRLFLVKKAAMLAPQDDCVGTWMVCTPQNIIKIAGGSGFSAVGYFFGTEIQATQRIPVGLVGTYWGGTSAQAWTSLTALQADPAFADFVQRVEMTRVNLAALKIQHANADVPKWEQDVAEWKSKPEPKPAQPWRPNDPEHNPGLATTLFNGMIHPIVGYGIKGAIWYQGEANTGTESAAKQYTTLFPALITDWRNRWGQGDFPFLFVQLANFGPGLHWPHLRNSQLKTLSLPHTGMAVTIDLGEQTDIHPTNKADVGHRLALAARHVAYGEKLVFSGPVYQSMSLRGNKAVLHFAETGGELTILAAPSRRLGEPAEPQAFEVAGPDKRFVPARAAINGDTVEVWSDAVATPTAVRYAWSGFPQPAANLGNREGLPASPFSTERE